MPTQPPAFRPAGWREPKPWQRPGLFQKDKRKRGRAGMKERAEILAAEPCCRLCAKAGKTVGADVVDHIVPLSWGGSDDRGNKQPLCDPCHDAKSKREREIDRNNRSKR